MSIEKNIERIADALETIAAAHTVEMTITPASSSSTKPAKSPKKSGSKPAKSEPSTSEQEVSKDDVRDALKALQKAKGAAAARDLLAENGAKTLTDLDESHYAALIESATERANG